MSEKNIPNQAFLKAFEAATRPVEGSRSAYLWDNKVIVDITAGTSHDEVTINDIRSFEVGQGHGKQAIGAIGALADQFGVALRVDAIPTDPTVRYGAIEKFFRGQGFSAPRGHARTMWREPAEQQQENNAMTAGPVAF